MPAGFFSLKRSAYPLGTPLWQRWIGPYSAKHPSGLLDDDGGVSSARPHPRLDHSCAVPFGFTPTIEGNRPIACIIHAFYPDVLPSLISLLDNITGEVDLFISTDTVEKRAEIAGICMSYGKGAVDIRLAPNRGRDIAPKLIAFADVYARYNLFLHLHTKRSLHADALAQWGDYLTGTILGSAEIVASILHLFESDPKLGIVFPQHLFRLRKVLRWGHNYDAARRLLERLGVALQADWPLEFPSGSMFWGRGAALKPLLDLGLTFEAFSEEAGQVDGTLAHAIERSILHIAERAGFGWLKIARRDLYPLKQTVLQAESKAMLAEVKEKLHAPLMPVETMEARRGPAGLVTLDPGGRKAGRQIALDEVNAADQHLIAGLSLWQRRDPVEAARWVVVSPDASARAVAQRLRNVVKRSAVAAGAPMIRFSTQPPGTASPVLAHSVTNSLDPAAWAEAIAALIAAMKRGEPD